MASWARCPSYPKPPKGAANFRNNKNSNNKVINYSYAQATSNAPRPQMAPTTGANQKPPHKMRPEPTEITAQILIFQIICKEETSLNSLIYFIS
ncbi:hypothetical protein NPIL_474411 [Nephila pilipes]|uniref:Uncharacterized protein n=1 Tax=Nephila pilipes TaxID=299642 RepID=A0A8X6INY6_NEPPI|nr:hypothetical protein NPIL_474411 [Nephila pilipes]